MDKTRCAACEDLFAPQCNVSDQTYCSKPECQRERRRRWQRQKLREDPDYRANQTAAQRPSGAGASAIPTIGAAIAGPTRRTPSATANSSAKGTAIAAKPPRVHLRRRLQRWTCARRKHVLLQGLTG